MTTDHGELASVHVVTLGLLAVLCTATGCRGPAGYRRQADRATYASIDTLKQELLGRSEPFSIEPASETLRERLLIDHGLPTAAPASLGSTHAEKPRHWPDKGYPPPPRIDGSSKAPTATPLELTLLDALQVAARNSRSYQAAKEAVFTTALGLDLQRDAFRARLDAGVESSISTDLGTDPSTDGSTTTASADLSRTFENGATVSAAIGADLARLLGQENHSSLGVFADASISIPLLRGAGAHIVREALTQAERDTIYAIWSFEEFKRSFAVETASEYFGVLRLWDSVRNASENLERVEVATDRSAALAEAGRLPEIQLDQARQNGLGARDRLVTSRQAYERGLDAFKVHIGLPPDAELELDADELERLATTAADATNATLSAEDVERSVRHALKHRHDMSIAIGQVYDTQRKVVVTADALRPGLALVGTAAAGERRSAASAGEPDAELAFDKGVYSAQLSLELPTERTAERNAYREGLVAFEQATRALQEKEDGIKLAVRNAARKIEETRQSILIQRRSVELAERREKSTDLFLKAGRADTRDLLEAQDALLSTRNQFTAALIASRIAQLELQRAVGTLEVNSDGLWRETPLRDVFAGQNDGGTE